MKIAIIGYGKMGKMIESLAKTGGDEIVVCVDENNRYKVLDEDLRKADVAIEFTQPDVAVNNYKWCFDNGVPVVSGTTGWLDRKEEVLQYCKEHNGGFFYSSNFSIGVNIFFKLNEYLAKMMNGFKDYKVIIEETHHIHKLDAPSGTAIKLAEGIVGNNDSYRNWKLGDKILKEGNDNAGKGTLLSDYDTSLPIVAKRVGEIPGIHTVLYKSLVDEIEIHHSAYSREGFAKGALLAAHFMKNKRGIFGMDDLLRI